MIIRNTQTKIIKKNTKYEKKRNRYRNKNKEKKKKWGYRKFGELVRIRNERLSS